VIAVQRPHRPTLLYDGNCRFCRACARLVYNWDRSDRLAILPFSHPAAIPLADRLPLEQRWQTIHLVNPDLSIKCGGDALSALLALLPAAGWIGGLTRRYSLAQQLVNSAYDFTSGQRPWLSGLVPDTRPVVRWP
jgi:predicted DCC family thiol-disulfide oxidoreductase YuxK